MLSQPRMTLNLSKDHYRAFLSECLIISIIQPRPPAHSFRLTGSIDRPAFIKNSLDSFSTHSQSSLFSYPATIRQYLISSTFMPHSSLNSILTPITSGSPRIPKHARLSQAPRARLQPHHRSPHLELKPSPI